MTSRCYNGTTVRKGGREGGREGGKEEEGGRMGVTHSFLHTYTRSTELKLQNKDYQGTPISFPPSLPFLSPSLLTTS